MTSLLTSVTTRAWVMGTHPCVGSDETVLLMYCLVYLLGCGLDRHSSHCTSCTWCNGSRQCCTAQWTKLLYCAMYRLLYCAIYRLLYCAQAPCVVCCGFLYCCGLLFIIYCHMLYRIFNE